MVRNFFDMISAVSLVEPTTGLLAEAYKIFSGLPFSTQSQSTLLETIPLLAKSDIAALPPVMVFQRWGSYTVCGGFRNFQVYRTARLAQIPVILVDEPCPLAGLRHELHCLHSYCYDYKALKKQLKLLQTAFRELASDELKVLVKQDPFLQAVLFTTKRELRVGVPPTSNLAKNIKRSDEN